MAAQFYFPLRHIALFLLNQDLLTIDMDQPPIKVNESSIDSNWIFPKMPLLSQTFFFENFAPLFHGNHPPHYHHVGQLDM